MDPVNALTDQGQMRKQQLLYANTAKQHSQFLIDEIDPEVIDAAMPTLDY
jgi:hypothetical protein